MSKQLETAIYFSIFLHMSRKIFNKMRRPRHIFRTRQYKPRGNVWISKTDSGVWVLCQADPEKMKEGIRRVEQFESSPDMEYCWGDSTMHTSFSKVYADSVVQNVHQKLAKKISQCSGYQPTNAIRHVQMPTTVKH